LQKTPPSGLSSELARLPAGGRLAAAAPRHAPRRNGRANGASGGVTTESQGAEALAARLRLMEGFVSRTDIADCAQYALQWLATAADISRSICLARPVGDPVMTTVGAHNLPFEATVFSLSVDDWNNPLVAALGKRHTFFPAPHNAAERRRRPSTPFDDAPFHAIPLAVRSELSDRAALGLLLFSAERPLPDLQWFSSVFGQKLDQILRQRAFTEGDRRQGRERTLLYGIINAVTDPILLTDTEGRLVIANSRALALFTASEEESEGRRSAVRMNNMLLSSALSSKAIEETGATRRELLLVNPADGSDLLFELLSTVTDDPRHGTGVVSILRNVTDLRRATEEIEENYRKLRTAEVLARAESDRLNLIIDSVADPIVV